MAAGFRDIFAWLLGWQSVHKFWQTNGPYRVAAAATFSAGATAGGVTHAGATAGMIG
jgi:hypothetical protein